jgi:hypothetical protein
MFIRPSYSSGYKKTGKKIWLIRIFQNIKFLKNNPKKIRKEGGGKQIKKERRGKRIKSHLISDYQNPII